MESKNLPPETNIGQVIYGSVTATTLVINVGGQPRQLAEIDGKQLRDVRKTVIKRLTYRRAHTAIPTLIFAVLVFWLWSLIPQAVANMPDADAVTKDMTSLGMLIGSAVAAWMVIRIYSGTWAKRRKNTIAELEAVLAKIDAELDMRTPSSGSTLPDWLRTLITSLRS
ncbi:hypothetical protein [Pseudoxanthomonas wuyuanensis]|uniref:Uncharacterized protein n=1 Tax=Pseudoxanthomonas wuyuanensis TaxID=1073196 RepID=A0A286D4R6_9GAMM|nr:hypothetical protein [Pseudoxanthomonas wuyuanensis]KAF1719791.1 hypothetical protein CSC75_13975 [Pseudoxanthomonas wuyuanensis]SOD53638.1 hypothetical protein SAMN06296416_102513 [Pseudoxanthomonas wuyuanensis]